jgi:hypothetical protein
MAGGMGIAWDPNSGLRALRPPEAHLEGTQLVDRKKEVIPDLPLMLSVDRHEEGSLLPDVHVTEDVTRRTR